MPSLQPPQRQERQPGIEAEMMPRPEFMPRYPGAGRLNGKIVLISGGDSGIGRAVSVAMAREGASIFILFKDEEGDFQETARRVEAEGGQCEGLAGDIADQTFCREAVKQCLQRFARIDILVNNAAEQHVAEELEDLPAEQLVRTFRTNVFGVFFLTQAALPHLPEGGVILNTTSITAFKGSAELLDYSATRGAIVAFTRSLAQSVLKRGIRVNAVAPGPIWTPLIPASFDAERVASHGQSAPMERPGQPNEVAPCFVFLASDDASYMTGQILHPNGGTIVGS